jgi:hypothetical protein
VFGEGKLDILPNIIHIIVANSYNSHKMLAPPG